MHHLSWVINLEEKWNERNFFKKRLGRKAGANVVKCKVCNGKGRRVGLRQIGPFVQQVVYECSDVSSQKKKKWSNSSFYTSIWKQKCQGKGESVADSDRCKNCFGEPLKGTQTFKLYIEKGMSHSEKINFRGESHAIVKKKEFFLVPWTSNFLFFLEISF